MSAPAIAGRPVLTIRGTPYPVLLPKVSDPRLHLAAVIITLQVLGQTANLQRDDHRREVEAGVAHLREQDWVGRAANRQHRPAGDGGRAHERSSYCDLCDE